MLYSALKVILICWLFLFTTPVFAQTVPWTTCKGEVKTWEDIDKELGDAGYGGPFDHSQKEFDTYKDLYNKANCSGSSSGSGSTTSSPSSASPSGQVAVGGDKPLTKEEYDYLYHNQAQVGLASMNTAIGVMTNICLLNKEHRCLGAKTDLASGETNLVLTDPKTYPGGAIAQLGSIAGALYDNRPASSAQYLAQTWENSLIGVKPAFAQVGGSGQGIIAPILNLWMITRNMAFMFFIIVLLVIGFMIMFRQRVSQNAVVSAQQALPGVIIGIILVYFSYFIAAFLVDLTFVGIQLVIYLLAGPTINNAFGDQATITELSKNANAFQLFWTAATSGESLNNLRSGAQDQIGTSLGIVGGSLVPAILGVVVGFITLSVPGAIIGGLAGLAAPIILPLILILVLLVALFIQIFKLIFSLISAYISILLYTVGGPFYILYGSLPGKSAAISTWWRGILANALIFPAVFGTFLAAGVVLSPSVSITTTLPLFGGLNGDFIKGLIGYGIILGSPAVPGMVTQAFGVKGPTAFMGAATSGFMGGYGAIAGGVSGGIAGMMRRGGLAARREAIRRRQIEAEMLSGIDPRNLSWTDRIISRLPG